MPGFSSDSTNVNGHKMTPSVFLKVSDGKLILWDYRQHTQFELEIDFLKRIMELSAGDSITSDGMDQTIKESGILDDPEPSQWGWDCLSRIFHTGTQIGIDSTGNLPSNDAYRGYIDHCASIVDKVPEMYLEFEGPVTPLPPPDLGKLDRMSLRDALLARETCRAFHAKSLDLAQVGTTLWATFGAVHGTVRTDLEEQGLMPVGYRRTSPSGGSLHPSEPYLVALRVEGLAPGIYHYRSHTHELTRVVEHFDPARLGGLLCAQNFAEDLSYGVFIVSKFDKLWWKYPHSRAYRVALLDIGCLIQTFQLTCAALGVQSWPTGYFVDHEINKLLAVDESTSSATFFLGAGIGSGSISPEALTTIRRRSREHGNAHSRGETGA